jgi:hypothetical protein
MAFPSPISRIRQHHALEHATITLLSRRLPGVQLVARSDFQGFIVVGNVDTHMLAVAAEEGLARLEAGESRLAVHPNCGTNLVTAGVLSGLAALVATTGRSRSLADRLPSAVLAATVALLAAAPAGRWAQENLTTTPDVCGARIVAVRKLEGGPLTRHRVYIAHA